MLDDVPGFEPKENVETTPEVEATPEAPVNTEVTGTTEPVGPQDSTDPIIGIDPATVEATPALATDTLDININPPVATDETANYKITGDVAVLDKIREIGEVLNLPTVIGSKLVEDGLAELVD